MNNTSSKFICGAILAFLAWFSVIFQFYLAKESYYNVISYFTILCNLSIALNVTFSTFFPNTKLGFFCSNISVQTAIALYIFIVGLVYNTVLRGIWTPTGWQLIVDNLLHVILPVLFTLYWFFFAEKAKLNWKDGIYWIFFPLFYLVYSLIRGALVNWYPYPFLNAAKLGYEKVVLNIGTMLVIFFVAGAILIVVNNKFVKK